MLLPYRLSFNTGLAQRLLPGEQCTSDAAADRLVTPRYGYCWWFWLPKAHYNGGRPDRNEVLDLTWSWLCFWCSFTAWPKQTTDLPRLWFHSSLDGLRTAPRGTRHSSRRKAGLRRA
jgi:hypothetical protein